MRDCSGNTGLNARNDGADAVTRLPRSGLRLAVYLINMDSAEDRLTAMRDKLEAVGLKFRRISGVDGRTISFPIPEFCDTSYKLMHGRRRTPPEIGCYLSHIACTRSFLAGDADLALILEDDAALQPDILDVLDRAAMQRRFWNILRLSTVNRGRKLRLCDLGDGQALAIALTREKGAGAYVIDRRAAHWFIDRLLPMRLAWDIAFDMEFMAGLKAVFVTPLPASQVSAHPTQIQSGLSVYKLPRWRYLTVLPFRAWVELNRFVARGFRLMLGRLIVATDRQSGGVPPV